MAMSQHLGFVRQRLDQSVNAVHYSGSLIEVDFIERVTRRVIVGISKYCGVSNHDRPIVLLPERPVIRPPHAWPFGRSSNAFGWEASGFAKSANRSPHQVSGFGIPNKSYEVPAT